jgi:hypothetical protein
MYWLWSKSFEQLLPKLSTIIISKYQAFDWELLIINTIAVAAKHTAKHSPSGVPKHLCQWDI